ncbi:MAG: nucleoside diphosphate kinase regulator [Bryobacterales bacterium]|nr:nucleoside diphosphate kinase regulator [Bryobacterales bacterium]
MRNPIYVTGEDLERLRRLIDGRRAGNPSDFEYLSKLEEELERAEIVDRGTIPRDVITMNSEVRLKDLDSGEEKVYKLVFPSQVRAGSNNLSVLAPIGTALLGYRVGDVIEWQVPKGWRRLQVLEILYQPEAAAIARN